MKTKVPATWIVVVRCNMDDVIAGAYPNITMARVRSRSIRDGTAEPKATSANDRMEAWGDSGLIAVAIYRVRGDAIRLWEQHSFDEQREAA